MQFAPPMVSQADICLTRFWSYNIFLIENANERVTAKGRPSGMATTTTVIAMIKYLTKSPAHYSLQPSGRLDSSITILIINSKRIRIALASPNLPMSLI